MCRQSTKATVHHVSLKPIICQMKWIVTNAILYYSFLRSHLVISVVVVVVLSSHLLFSYNEIQFLGLVCLELLFLFGQSHVDNFFRIFFTNCFSCGCCCFFSPIRILFHCYCCYCTITWYSDRKLFITIWLLKSSEFASFSYSQTFSSFSLLLLLFLIIINSL